MIFDVSKRWYGLTFWTETTTDVVKSWVGRSPHLRFHSNFHGLYQLTRKQAIHRRLLYKIRILSILINLDDHLTLDSIHRLILNIATLSTKLSFSYNL